MNRRVSDYMQRSFASRWPLALRLLWWLAGRHRAAQGNFDGERVHGKSAPSARVNVVICDDPVVGFHALDSL